MHERVLWFLHDAPGPIVATAIHAGHALRPEVAERMALAEADRLREEDPYTDGWTIVGDAQVIATHSRFQVDLNRSRDKAVYLRPEDAWGLDVWGSPPPAELVARSLADYDAFYTMLAELIDRRLDACDRVVVLDLHSYNHRRGGPGAAPDDPALNPEINIGTGSMPRQLWSGIVVAFIEAMAANSPSWPPLDVRENVKFQGGYMSRWLHETFPERVCAIAVEIKKFYMDEWSGRLDPEQSQRIENRMHTATAQIRALLRAG